MEEFNKYLLSTSYVLVTVMVSENKAVSKWTQNPGFVARTCCGALRLLLCLVCINGVFKLEASGTSFLDG